MAHEISVPRYLKLDMPELPSVDEALALVLQRAVEDQFRQIFGPIPPPTTFKLDTTPRYHPAIADLRNIT